MTSEPHRLPDTPERGKVQNLPGHSGIGSLADLAKTKNYLELMFSPKLWRYL
jgi:hypothetical protein